MKVSRRVFGFGLLGTAGLLALGVPFVARTDEDRFLEAALETLFPPGDGLPSAVELGAVSAIHAYLAELPWSSAWQARGLFRLLDTATFPGYGAMFSTLELEDRLAFLSDLAGSDLYPRRLMAHALKQICAVGYWQHPSTWGHLGYDGPTVGR
jgi:hypothetical protein